MKNSVHVSVISNLAAEGLPVGVIKIPTEIFDELKQHGHFRFQYFDAVRFERPEHDFSAPNVKILSVSFDHINRELRGNCQISDIALTFLANPKSALDALQKNPFILDSIAFKKILDTYKVFSEHLCAQ